MIASRLCSAAGTGEVLVQDVVGTLVASRALLRLPPSLAAYAEEPLTGRDSQIAALRGATAASAGRRAVLVLGEPGIGKTRHAAAAESHAEDAVVVLARCPTNPVVPFEPWVRAIGELVVAGGVEWREELARAAGPELSALVPELGELGEPVGESAGCRDRLGGGRAFSAAARDRRSAGSRRRRESSAGRPRPGEVGGREIRRNKPIRRHRR